MTRRFDIFFVAIAFLGVVLLATCRSSNEDTIVFRGRIDAPNAAEFTSALQSPAGQSLRWVEITSAGGDATLAFAMGRLIHERGLSVRVKAYCISACAEGIFLAGKKKRVERGALVLFHSTVGMTYRLHAAANDMKGAKLFAPIAADEDVFLDTIGVRADLTTIGLRNLEPFCIVIDDNIPESDPRRYGFASRTVAYALSRRLMEQVAGSPVEGFWPADRDEMRRTLGGLPFDDRLTVAWVDGPAPTRGARDRVPALPRCAPGLLENHSELHP